MKLSILIATLPDRLEKCFQPLVQNFMKQIGKRTDVEVIGVLDNRARSIGVKRQDLLNMANGEYLVFFDDDDLPSDDYVSSIMEVLDSNFPNQVDAVVFKVRYKDMGTGKSFICEYDKDSKTRGLQSDGVWRGPPCHTHVIKSSIAKSVKWLEHPKGNQWNIDVEWSNEVTSKIESQARIDKVLYYYNFNPKTSETLKNNRKLQKDA